jgi:prepilin-type N-terminal cleavage/methylation domain-containing protein
MSTKNSAGFTLIEIIVVIAISGALFAIIFTGQRQLRSRSSFDAALEQVSSAVADAHNQALAGINTEGPGTGTKNCGLLSAGAAEFEFAGTALSVLDAPTGATLRTTYFAASRNSPTSACVFSTRDTKLPTLVRLSPSGATQRVLYVRDESGGLTICQSTGSDSSMLSSFLAGACASPAYVAPADFVFTDPDGMTGTIRVGQNGFATRTN